MRPTSPKKTNGIRVTESSVAGSPDWQSVTGRFKVVFDQMEKDQEENNEKVKRQTLAMRRHAGEAAKKPKP